MHDVIVVGSGPSGVAAALELSDLGQRPLVLDVGYRHEDFATVSGNLYDYRTREDAFALTIGNDYAGLSNLLTERRVPVKLTAPQARYVTARADELSPIDENDFCAIQSFSSGGLANAWGAGLYRYTDDDLTGFPITASDLEPYFDKLTQEIGISGADDDLARDFGPATGLLDPVEFSNNIASLYERYLRQRHTLYPDIRIGRARLGVLTRSMDGRPAFGYNSHEFFTEDRSIYSPRYTLDKLVMNGRVQLVDGVIVRRFEETPDHVRVHGTVVATGEGVEFDARRLILAAGAINTSKIVLKSHDDVDTELPLLENPALQFPLILPRSFGRPLDKSAFGLAQLNLVWESETFGERLQGSIMEITAPSRSEFFGSLPYAARSNLGLIRTLLPAMVVMQLFFPASSQPPARLSLQTNDRLRIDGHPNLLDLAGLAPLLRAVRRIGAYTMRRFVVRVPTGHAAHYAGTLPMRRDPSRYECDPRGRLAGTERVFIGDSAAFTQLSAKNMALAIMAHGMRTAAQVAADLENGR